jgi:signal transduction histidine kinase
LDGSAKTQQPDRWWIVAMSVAIVGAGLVILLWNFPTSKWVWLLAGIVLLFVAVLFVNPRYRYWRRANVCFGIAGLLAFVPTFIAKANLEGIGSFEFVSEASPLVVLGFLGAGLYMAWLDACQHVSSVAKAGITTANTNLQSFNSPHAVTGLTAGGDIVINQGVSEETLHEVIDAKRVASRIQASSQREVDEDLVWRLIDDIKDAQRRFEQEDVNRLLSDLQKSVERSGRSWSKVLRTESLLLMAEEERARISRSRVEGNKVDLTRLRELLKEVRDA